MLLSKLQRERYPDQIDRKTRLSKALEDLERGGNVLVKYATDIAQNPSVTMAEAAAKRAEETVAAATAA